MRLFCSQCRNKCKFLPEFLKVSLFHSRSDRTEHPSDTGGQLSPHLSVSSSPGEKEVPLCVSPLCCLSLAIQ